MSALFWLTDYIASYVECLMCCIFCGTFIDRQALKNRKRLFFILPAFVGAVAMCLNIFKIFSFANTFIIFLVCIACQWIIFRQKKPTAVLMVVIYFVILSAVDFSVAAATARAANVNVMKIMGEHGFIRLFCTLFSKAFLSLIVITVNRLTKQDRPIVRKYSAALFACSSFMLISNFAFVRLYIENPEGSISSFAVIYFLASLFITALMFYFTTKLSSFYEKQQTTSLIEIQNKMLKKSLDESQQAFKLWRKSIHDYKNNIFALNKLAENEDIDGIKSYLEQQIGFVNKQMFYIKTGNQTVDTIIYINQSKCEQKGINFIANAIMPTKCEISDIDLSSVLGNLLDNAVEASENEPSPQIELNIKQRKNFLIIAVDNRFTLGEPEFNRSSKANAELHGIGLKSVQSIVKKYGGDFSIQKQNEIVRATVMLPNGATAEA